MRDRFLDKQRGSGYDGNRVLPPTLRGGDKAGGGDGRGSRKEEKEEEEEKEGVAAPPAPPTIIRSHVQDRFRKVYTQGLWLDRDTPGGVSRSGSGSNPLSEPVKEDSRFLKRVMRQYLADVDGTPHIVDVPCGDMAWMPRVLKDVLKHFPGRGRPRVHPSFTVVVCVVFAYVVYLKGVRFQIVKEVN